jgi:hypothetical protein
MVHDMSLTYRYSRVKVNSNYSITMLAHILKMNDNTRNTMDDSYWKANLIDALGHCNNPIYNDDIYREIVR